MTLKPIILGFVRPRVLSRRPRRRLVSAPERPPRTRTRLTLVFNVTAVGYPLMDLYPEVNTDPTSSPSIGLLQPNGSMTSLNQ